MEEAPETWGDCYTEVPVPGEGVWGLCPWQVVLGCPVGQWLVQ